MIKCRHDILHGHICKAAIIVKLQNEHSFQTKLLSCKTTDSGIRIQGQTV